MYTQGLGAIINIILDPIFIFALNMGVAGAAIATVIGQLCGCGPGHWFNHEEEPPTSPVRQGLPPRTGSLIGEIYAIGLPSVIMIAIGSVMTFLMNKILITYHAAHETAATAFGTYFKLNSFIFMPVFGMNNGVVPIVAYNYGARNRKRMVETIKRGALYASIIMVFGTVLFWVIPGPLLKIFDATDTLLSVGVPALRIISLSFCMAGASIALGSLVPGLGQVLLFHDHLHRPPAGVPHPHRLRAGPVRRLRGQQRPRLVELSHRRGVLLTLTLCFFRHVYKTTIAPSPRAANKPKSKSRGNSSPPSVRKASRLPLCKGGVSAGRRRDLKPSGGVEPRPYAPPTEPPASYVRGDAPKGTCSASLHCVGIRPYIRLPSVRSVFLCHSEGAARPWESVIFSCKSMLKRKNHVFENGLPRQSADWLAMTGFFDTWQTPA